MRKHSEGPWRVSRLRSGDDLETAIVDADQNIVARLDIWRGEIMQAEESANAHLIAAAPDLLAALDNLVDWCREHVSPVHNPEAHLLLLDACNAISKAKGE